MKGRKGTSCVKVKERFGKLVVRSLHQRTTDGHQQFVVRCDCGEKDYAWSFALRAGTKDRCGLCAQVARRERRGPRAPKPVPTLKVRLTVEFPSDVRKAIAFNNEDGGDGEYASRQELRKWLEASVRDAQTDELETYEETEALK